MTLVRKLLGIDASRIKSTRAMDSWITLREPTELLLRLVGLYREDADLVAIAREFRQCEHFIANPFYPQVTDRCQW